MPSNATNQVDTTHLRSLDILRVIAIFFVMLIHSTVSGDVKDRSGIFFLVRFLEFGAVPVFFLLSGYLGARKINSKDVSAYRYAKDKYHTLIVPFLFWNALVLSLVFIAKLAGLHHIINGNGAYFDVKPTFTSIASALFGIGRSPIVYQFWFLRDLIVVSAASFVACRYLPRIPLLSWLLFFIPVPMASSMGYYLLGYNLQTYLPVSKFPSPKLSGIYCTVWILLGWGVKSTGTQIPYPLLQIGSAAFLFFFALMLYHFTWGKQLAAIGTSTFIVYAMHEPMQTIISKAWQAQGWPGYGSLFGLFLIPIIVFPLCVLVYFTVKRLCPFMLQYMTGGR